MKKMLKTGEVAALLGVHPRSVRRWCEQGVGPRFRKTPFGHHLFAESDVRAWIASMDEQPAPAARGNERTR